VAYDAATVANRFIELAAADGREFTPMQLIKLSYIAHGFSLAIYKRPLLKEAVEAWRYGPVIPSLYKRLKTYGSDGVSQPVRANWGRKEALEDEDRKLLDIVFQKYGHLTGIQLSHLTHRNGTPWAESYSPDEYGTDIDDKLIRTHYATLLSK